MTSNALHLTVLMALLDLPLTIEAEEFFFFLLAFFGGGEGSSSLDAEEGDDRASCCTFFFSVFVFLLVLRRDLTPTHCPNLQVNFSSLSELVLLPVF